MNDETEPDGQLISPVIQQTAASDIRNKKNKLTEAVGPRRSGWKLNKDRGKRAYLRALKRVVKRKMKKK